LADLGVDGRIKLKFILKIHTGRDVLDWFHLAQYKVKLRIMVDTAMNLRES